MVLHCIEAEFVGYGIYVAGQDRNKHSSRSVCLVRAALLNLLIFVFLLIPGMSQPASAVGMGGPGSQIPARFRIPARSLITENIDPARTMPTLGAVHPEVALSKDAGPVEGSLVLDHLQLVLRRPQERQAAFDALI